jgi:hypothetical protein
MPSIRSERGSHRWELAKKLENDSAGIVHGRGLGGVHVSSHTVIFHFHCQNGSVASPWARQLYWQVRRLAARARP